MVFFCASNIFDIWSTDWAFKRDPCGHEVFSEIKGVNKRPNIENFSNSQIHWFQISLLIALSWLQPALGVGWAAGKIGVGMANVGTRLNLKK